MEPDFLQNINEPEKERAAELFHANQTNVFKQTDRMFSILLPVQWLAGVVTACYFTPLTWNGEQSSIHPHVWSALLIGGAITSLPFFLTVFQPGEKITRYVVAVSQMLMSGLLIHITDGRAETHFHLFGSLAFLACYRDWRLLIPATIITAFDHFFRGWLYPFSIYGTVNSSEWRWLEHAGWVVFIDIFLIFSCMRSVRTLRELSAKTAATNSSEERYRTIIEQMTESIFLLEVTDLKVVECNQAFADLLGCQSIEEAKTLYAQDFDAFKPQEIRLMTSYLDRDKTKSMSAERKYLRRDGTWIYVEITGRFITYNDTAAYCVNARDITGRKQTQMELKKLALVAEKTQNAVIITDPEGKITWVNEGFTRLTEYRLDEVIGHKRDNFLQGRKTNRETIAAIHEAFIQRQPYNGEIYNYRKNKIGYWCSLSIMPITSHKGDLKGFISIEMDITERKAMEEKLQLSYEDLEVKICERTAELVTANKAMQIEVAERKHAEENLQNSRDYLDQIINAVADPIFVKNRQHQLTLVNDVICRFTGQSREEILGKTTYNLFSPHGADLYSETDELVFTSGKENVSEEEFTDLRGNKRIIVTRKRVHIDKDGEQFIVGVSRDITIDRKNEKRLKDGEIAQRQLAERQSAILDALPAHICLLDQAGNILEVNNEWKQFSIANDYSGNNFGIGSNYIETCENSTGECTEGANQAAEICRAVLAGETAHFEMEYPCHSPNEKRWFKLTVNALHKDKFAGAVVMHVNITERKLAEEALQNSRNYLDQIMNSVSSPIFVKNRNHELTLVNDAMCQLMKRSREDSIGKTDHDVYPANEADVYQAKDELVFTSKKENINEESLTDSDGNLRIIVTKKRLHIDKEGAEYIVGVINDITELKLAEHNLSEAKQFLSSVIDNIPNLISVKDLEGRYVLANRALAELYDTNIENVIGKTDADFIDDPAVIERRRLAEQTVIDTLEEVVVTDEKIADADGNTRWFQRVKRPLIGDKGIESILGIATDLTEAKIIESQLRQAQKMESIGQLAAGIAHEINTPTQYVSDNTRFISDAFDDFKLIFGKYGELLHWAESGEIKPELLSEIKKEVESSDFEYLLEEVPKAIQQSLDGVSRIAKIVQSMKDFAHPGTSLKQSADLNRAIESTVTVARNEWKYVAEIETRFDENLPLVPCFLGEFNQVVLNMVINAAHSISDVLGEGSQSKGKITITTTKVDNDWAEVRIGDTGNGIPPEIQEKIFDPFFTTKEVGKGTGQGLAISHTVVVDKHQGQLNFETETGRGTTFIIRLPLDNTPSSKQN